MDENCCPHCNRILGTHVTCPMCMKYLVIEGASLILPHHVKEAREKVEEWFERLGKDAPEDLVKPVRTLYTMICDHLAGAKKDLSPRTIALAAFGLLYVTNPMDLVPDPIRRVGYMDDMRILQWVEEAMGPALEEYCHSRNGR